nr:MAG TPA: nucleoid-associated protein [Caudoviricetes sp.]
MIIIHCARACAHLASPPELLTAGMAKAVTVEFEFTEDWAGLTKTAVFTNGKTTVDVLQSHWQGNTVTIPAEVLTTAGRYVRVGVYGSNADGVALPTIWADLGKVRPGAEPSGDASTDPALPVWAQLQALIGDLDDLTTKAKDNLVAAINEAAKTGSGGSGSIDLRVADGYIQYSNDGGATWENLIAIADLKGDDGAPGTPGTDGKDGAPGQDGYSPSASVSETDTGATITITDKTGTTTAEIKNGKDGKDGAPGKDGTTFTPSVSASGDLSWTNDGGKENPETVNIKGPQGSPGITPNIQIGTVTTLQAGSDATASVSGTAENPLLNLGIPKGEAGGSDLSLGVTGAAVGQIARITAVDSDGKPTAWSPVDMAGGGGGETWELINEVTLSEDVMAVVFDKDKSGAAFALRKFAVFGWTKGSNASNTNGGTICINVANTADDIYSIVPPVYAHGALKGDQLRYWHAAAENFAEKGWRWYITGADNTRATNKANIGTSLTLLSQTIPKVATYLALWSRTSGSAFVAGSKIELYGVRA